MEEAPGMPFIHPKGMIIWNRLLDFLQRAPRQGRLRRDQNPSMMSQELWETSGHWHYYRDNMYAFANRRSRLCNQTDELPRLHALLSNHKPTATANFPLRVAEIGHVHRHEASGALSGLFRVRSFHQDDAHLFMRPSDIKDEILRYLRSGRKDLHDLWTCLTASSSRHVLKRSIGTDEDWEIATNGLKGALDDWGQSYRINEGDGAFYGPKIDIHIRDALGRSWQCGTVQLDMALPEKFELEYMDSDGQLKRPIMIHRALFGSIERFFGILIEHFAGKFPLWISPIQVAFITVADRHNDYAHRTRARNEKSGIYLRRR